MGIFDVFALEDVEEGRNDAIKNTMSKIRAVPVTGLTPAIIMKQCEEIMAKLKVSAMQRTEAHEQCGSSGSGQRDGCSRTDATLMTGSRAAGGPRATWCMCAHRGNGFSSGQEWMVLCGGIDLVSHR